MGLFENKQQKEMRAALAELNLFMEDDFCIGREARERTDMSRLDLFWFYHFGIVIIIKFDFLRQLSISRLSAIVRIFPRPPSRQ